MPSGYFADRNTSKRSVTINLKTSKGVDLVRELIKKSDIVANNFTPGTMEKLGLGYDDLERLRPGIIYLGMSFQGADGPERDTLGFGLTIGALVANSICPMLLQEVFTKDGVTDFRGLFMVPLVAGSIGAIALALLFHPPAKSLPASEMAGTAA